MTADQRVWVTVVNPEPRDPPAGTTFHATVRDGDHYWVGWNGAGRVQRMGWLFLEEHVRTATPDEIAKACMEGEL